MGHTYGRATMPEPSVEELGEEHVRNKFLSLLTIGDTEDIRDDKTWSYALPFLVTHPEKPVKSVTTL